jgi:capsular polysaccharide biosynthesis protein
MMQRRWEVSDLDDGQSSSGPATPTLVSLHFIRSALRRRWLVCALSAVLGLLMAAAYLVAFPQPHNAKAALVLTHDEGVDPTLAMATDIGLLMSRTVAAKTVENLGLKMTPDDFVKSVAVERTSPELLSVTLTGPSDAEAVRRLEVLTSIYLAFRAEQLSSQSNVFVDGIQERIKKLEREVSGLTRDIDELSASGTASATKLSETISQRAYIEGKIESLQQSAEDVSLRSTSVVSSSRVIDPPATKAGGAKRRMVLTLASGFIGGAALGCGMVLVLAITSEKLRRRSDVASAVDKPVRVSVGRIAPLPKRWLWLPHLRTLDRRRADERQRLAHAIEMELPVPRRWGRIGVACIENADEVGFAIATAARDLVTSGSSVTLIDLTEQQASLEVIGSASIPGSANRPTVLRPRGIPALARSAAELDAVGNQDGDGGPAWPQLTDVTLVLADLDPEIGADHLKAWTDRVIIVVTAGRSSAEQIRTSADLVRSAGLDLQFAALLHAEPTDHSSGLGDFDRPVPIDVVDRHDQPAYAQASVDEQGTADLQAPAGAEPSAAPQNQSTNGQRTAEDRILNKEHITALTGQVGSEGQLAGQEQAVSPPEDTMTVDDSHLGYVDSAPVHIGSAPSFAVGNLDLSLDHAEPRQNAMDGRRNGVDGNSSARDEPTPSSADDEEIHSDWHWELDALADQDSAAIDSDEDADTLSDVPSLTMSENDEEHRPSTVIPGEKDAGEEASRQAGGGHGSNGQVRQRTRTRGRRRRSRLR